MTGEIPGKQHGGTQELATKLRQRTEDISQWAPTEESTGIRCLVAVVIQAAIVIFLDWICVGKPWAGGAPCLAPVVPANEGEILGPATTQLGLLFIIALFFERSLEVYLKVWRQMRRDLIEEHIAAVKEYVDRVPELYNNDPARIEEALQIQNKAKRVLARYRAKSRHIAMTVGVCLALLLALVGPRLLKATLTIKLGATVKSNWQLCGFDAIDIIITVGLVGGGSAVIHEVMALITDSLYETRKRAQQPS